MLIWWFTVGTNYWIVGNSVYGRYETCVWRRQNSHAQKSAKATILISFVHFKLSCNTWSCSLAVSNVGLWSGKFSELNMLETFNLTLMIPYYPHWFRTREYQLLMHSLIRTSTKVGYVTTRACVNVVIPHLEVWDNTLLTLSPQPLNRSMTFGNEN